MARDLAQEARWEEAAAIVSKLERRTNIIQLGQMFQTLFAMGDYRQNSGYSDPVRVDRIIRLAERTRDKVEDGIIEALTELDQAAED